MRHAQILLSTFDGEAWLDPLLSSLAAQDHPDFSILVRDDGSQDRTVEILEGWAAREPRLRCYRGDHAGVPASFFELLERADETASWFAFCDQDDVWLPEKLSRAVARLDDLADDRPAMYFGRQLLVDAQLRPLGRSRPPRRGPSFRNALVENVATGCTVVINAPAREALARRRPSLPVMHDWWAYLVTAALGTVVYDDGAYVLYRQHRGNVVGSQHVRWRNWLQRIERFRRHRERFAIWEQAAELKAHFGDRLPAEERRILERFLARRRSRSAALTYALAPDVFRQTRLDDWIMRALIALGRI